MSWPVVVSSDSPEVTKAVAAHVAALCRAGDVLLLMGDLGAGKTAFAQGFAAALGVSEAVTSPTFALVRQYTCGAGQRVDLFIHADVYRTGSVAEIDDLALAELVEERAVALIEWGDRAAEAFGDDVLEVSIAQPDFAQPDGVEPSARSISMVGRGRWAGQASEVEAALSALGASS
jgi:tRNA threonylcarbamoyladenosine biosynthesis protein TsaE